MKTRLGQDGKSILDEFQDLLGLLQEQLPEIGEDDFPRFPFEERLAELILQLLDRPAQRRLGKVQFGGGPSNVLRPSHGDELLDLL